MTLWDLRELFEKSITLTEYFGFLFICLVVWVLVSRFWK